MAEITGKAFDLPILKRVLKFVNPYNKIFWITGVLTILLAAISPVRPWLIQYTIDNYVLVPNNAELLNMTILMLVLLVIEGVLQFYQTYLANWLGQTVIKDIRIKLYTHILSFHLKYFDKTPIGTLVTRVISDIETISDIFSQGILMIIGDLLKLIVVVIVMFYTDWRLTLISLSSIPVLLIATNIFKNAVKSAFQDVRTNVAKLNAFVQEHITGMNIVQVFNKEDEELEKFKRINAAHRDAHIRSVWAYSVFFPIVEILSSLSLAMLVWWGSKEVISHYTTVGNLVAFILYIYMMFRPIRQLADRFNVLQMGIVSSERVFKIIDTQSIIENRGEIVKTDLNGDIQFTNVWFTYDDVELKNGEFVNANGGNVSWVLQGISFDVKKGDTIAIVGSTGSGKTSIINILSRSYEFQKGEICVDGIDIRKYEINALRKQIGVVLQDVFLFSDTITNNITLHNPDISDEMVKNAAQSVNAEEFILKLPQGYDYNVHERGAMLSVGQRQLISFIRAYVYNPKILILDEATSSVDTESEQLIQYATEKITQGRTSIVIAHRLSTVQKASSILVIEKGRIIEEGTHQELLAKNGHYKKLYELQLK